MHVLICTTYVQPACVQRYQQHICSMHTAAIDYCKGSDSLLTNVTGTITNQLQEGVQRVFMIALWTDSNVASFPGCVRGEKVAWY